MKFHPMLHKSNASKDRNNSKKVQGRIGAKDKGAKSKGKWELNLSHLYTYNAFLKWKQVFSLTHIQSSKLSGKFWMLVTYKDCLSNHPLSLNFICTSRPGGLEDKHNIDPILLVQSESLGFRWDCPWCWQQISFNYILYTMSWCTWSVH